MLARLRPYVLLFLALSVVYHANLRPVDSGDTLPTSLLPFAIFLDHTVALDRFGPWIDRHVLHAGGVVHASRGHYYSLYPIGGGLLVSPLYFPLAFFGRLREWDPGSLVMLARIAEKFAAAAIAALSAVILLLLLKRITTAPWAWCLTLVYALGTETWSIASQGLWQHGPGELAIIGCFYFLQYWSEDRRRNGALWLCGACAAAAFIIRPTSVVLLPALFAALLIARATTAQHLRIWSVALLGGLMIASYNFYVFQNVSGGYDVASLDGSIPSGLAGLILSPGRGLLIYTPILVFAVFPFLTPIGARLRNPLLVAAVVFVIFDAIVMARWQVWWGGFCWGPRLLTELVPPLIVMMALGVSATDRSRLWSWPSPWPRRAFAVLALYSVLIQGVGVFFYPKGHWDATPQRVDKAPSRLWDWRDNPIARTVRGGFYWEPYAIVGAAFTGGFQAAQRRIRELNVNPDLEFAPAGVPSDGRELP